MRKPRGSTACRSASGAFGFSTIAKVFVHPHGKYFICHAGVRPGVPLERQSESDLIWIRDEFLRSKLDFGKIVVHGHTPTPEPEVLPNQSI